MNIDWVQLHYALKILTPIALVALVALAFAGAWCLDRVREGWRNLKTLWRRKIAPRPFTEDD